LTTGILAEIECTGASMKRIILVTLFIFVFSNGYAKSVFDEEPEQPANKSSTSSNKVINNDKKTKKIDNAAQNQEETKASNPVPSTSRNTADTPEIKTVVSSGLGKDVPSAAQNAAQNALTNVVGSFMDSTKLLEKRVEIEEGVRKQTSRIDTNIKEYSQGSIQSFEILETAQESGLTKVTAKVAIRVEDFKAYVKKLAEGEVNVAGESLFAQAAIGTKQTANKAHLLYDNVIGPIITGTVLQFDVGSPQPIEKVKTKGSFKDGDWPSDVSRQSKHLKDMIMKHGKENIFVFNVTVSVNKDFLVNMKRTMSSISSKKTLRETGNFYSRLRGPGNSDLPKEVINLKEMSENDIIIVINDGKAIGPIWSGAGELITSELYLVTDARQKFREISGVASQLVTGEKFNSGAKPAQNLQVSLLDASGEVLQEEAMLASPLVAGSPRAEDFKDKLLLTVPSDYTVRSGWQFKVPWVMLAEDNQHSSRKITPKINILERRTFDVIMAIQPEALSKTKKIRVQLTD
jgi:hypothetical protein